MSKALHQTQEVVVEQMILRLSLMMEQHGLLGGQPRAAQLQTRGANCPREGLPIHRRV